MTDGDPNKQLAAALGRIPSGLFIVTVRHGEAETGLLASWVQQCSFEPPCVTMAVKRGRPVLAWLDAGACFTVNILGADQTDMIAHFGRGFALDQQAFQGLDVVRAEGKAPVLAEALACLECRVVSRCTGGDHELFVAQIVAGRLLNEGQPMVHIRKSGLHY